MSELVYEDRPEPTTIEAVDRPGAYLSKAAVDRARFIDIANRNRERLGVKWETRCSDLAKAAGSWHTQREIEDPQSEAENGVDFDSETGEVDVNEFLKMIDAADIENDDETSAHLHKCGLHLCKAKLAHLSGDHEQCTRSINAAMASYGKFHQAMKDATED